MRQTPIVESIASSGGSVGARAARHLDLAIRQLMRGQGSVEDDRYVRLITGEQHPFGNMAILSDANSQDATASAITPLLDLAVPTMVLYTTGVGDAVAGNLVAQGFVKSGMPAMAVDIARLGSTALPAGCEWVRIGAGAAGSEWCDVLAAGYGLPRGLARMFSPEVLGANMAPEAATQFFGIRRDGRLVSTSMLLLADGLAGIYCVATLAEERGKGLGAHVTAEALRAAHAIGYRVGILQSSDAGHPVYLGLGFADVDWVPMFVRMPA